MRRFKVWNEVLKRWVDGQVCFLRADGDGFFMQDGKLCGMAPHYKVVFSTGLHDKNGKEIWEGDLIRDGGGWTWEVSFSNGKFYLLSREKDLRPDMDINTGLSYCQVLGNVHENKEPLNA